ncbi:MAG: RNA polymerase sigma factor, partial [Desulfohalobiaceae bacterium]
VVRNHLDHQRRSPTAHGNPHPLREEQAVDHATPETRAAAREETGRVQAALNALPVDTREALILRFVHDLPFHDLSQILQVSVSAAKMRVYRGLEQFRGALGGGENL